MTYADWRNFGYVSRLSDLVCKGPGEQIGTARGITNQQLSVASDAGQRASADYTQFKQLLRPLINKNTALATGNREVALAAAMPVLSQLSRGWQGAKQNVLNTMPTGAARDRALADLDTSMFSNIAGAQAGMVQSAPDTLANIGTNLGNLSLNETGAQLSALGGGSQTNEGAMKAAAESQKSWLNFFSGLAQTAGSAATSFFAPAKAVGGCWIAEAVYGPADSRTFVVRRWLNGPYRETPTGRWVMALYLRVGRPVAWFVRRSAILRAAFKPLFDRALRHALSARQPSI